MKTVEQNLPHLNFQVHGCTIYCALIKILISSNLPQTEETTITTEEFIVSAKSEKIPEP